MFGDIPVTVAVLPACATVATGDTVNTALPLAFVQATFAVAAVTPLTVKPVAAAALVVALVVTALDATPLLPVTTTLKV